MTERAPSDLDPAERSSMSASDGGEVARAGLGRRQFLAVSAGAAAAAAVVAGLPASTAAAATPFSSFEPAARSIRICNTRPDRPFFGGFTNLGGNTLRIPVAGRTVDGVTVPSDATAVVLTVVGINRQDGPNHVTVYPSDAPRPKTSNLNMFGTAGAVANLVTMKLGGDGSVLIHSPNPAHIVVDFVGAYRPTGGEPVRAGRFELLRDPSTLQTIAARRLVSPQLSGVPADGATVRVDLTSLVQQGIVESDAIAVAANITVAGTSARGHVTAFPFGQNRPSTSTMNYAANEVRAGASIVKLGTDSGGRVGFNVHILRSARLYVDISGFFTGEGSAKSTTGQFVPIVPVRVLDSRSSNNALRGVTGEKRLWAGWFRRFTLPASFASQAGAVAVNLTANRSHDRGHFTLLPGRTPMQNVSNLNVSGPNQTVANHAITALGDIGLDVYSHSGSHVLCDVVGWFTGTNTPFSLPARQNPAPPAAQPPYQLAIPRVGRTVETQEGSANPIVNTGRAWHWTGTGYAGQGIPYAVFAHRTDAGGPFRNIHWCGAGDRITIETPDQRRYTYEYEGREITSKFQNQILDATRRAPGEVLSLVACTVGNDRSKSAWPDAWAPTSLEYRIVVRFRMVTWEDISPFYS